MDRELLIETQSLWLNNTSETFRNTVSLYANASILLRTKIVMLEWDEVFCEVHGNDGLVWIENEAGAAYEFTVVCERCANRVITHADYELADAYASNFVEMQIQLKSNRSLDDFFLGRAAASIED